MSDLPQEVQQAENKESETSTDTNQQSDQDILGTVRTRNLRSPVLFEPELHEKST